VTIVDKGDGGGKKKLYRTLSQANFEKKLAHKNAIKLEIVCPP
jgi:hypothetical protein